MKTLYLAYGADYESFTPLAVFDDERAAKAMAESCSAYQRSTPRPEYPDYDDEAELETYMAELEAWETAHPCGRKAASEREFGVTPVDFYSVLADVGDLNPRLGYSMRSQ